MFVNAIRVGNKLSLGPVPDIFAQVSWLVIRESRIRQIGVGDNESRDQGTEMTEMWSGDLITAV